MEKGPLQGLSILILDDEARNIDVLQRLLTRSGYREVRATTDAVVALGMFRERSPDLILLDLHMPVMDGFAVMAAVREHNPAGTYLPILVLTGDLETHTKERALSAGATDFVTKPFEATEVLLRIRNLLETRHLHIRLQRYNEELEEKVRERTRELDDAQVEILQRLALAAEYRDDVTGQHAQRVGTIAALLARELGMDEDGADLIQRAAPLHDVGKIGIPDAILLKPGRLTPGEFDVMRTHVAIGARILDGSHFDLLKLAREIALSHHERWDGSGYNGLKGPEIPVSGRLVAVADVFDSLGHERPYKRALPLEEVVETISSERGRHFDPDVVDALLRLVERGILQERGLTGNSTPPRSISSRLEPPPPPSSSDAAHSGTGTPRSV
jgi:putative two-component system response regulator